MQHATHGGDEVVYVHLKDGKVNYIGITKQADVRAAQHALNAAKTGEQMVVVTNGLNHNAARTVEAALIRQRIRQAGSQGADTVIDQLKGAGLLNKNRGRLPTSEGGEKGWVKGIEADVEDFLIDFGEVWDIAN